MSRHCHSSNLSPKEFQRWTADGSSRSAVLSHVSVRSAFTKTQFEILILSENHVYLISNRCFVILAYYTGSMMSTFYLPVAEGAWHVSAEWGPAPEN